MKHIKTISIITLSLFIVACSGTDKKVTKKIEKEVEIIKENGETTTYIAEDLTAEEFKAKIAAGGATLVDVRTPAELAGGIIEGAINIDFNDPEFKSKIDELDKTKPVLVYCAAGGRSGKTKDLLHDLGFQSVYNLLGGYSQWPYKK